jgi:hypothetical protein
LSPVEQVAIDIFGELFREATAAIEALEGQDHESEAEDHDQDVKDATDQSGDPTIDPGPGLGNVDLPQGGDDVLVSGFWGDVRNWWIKHIPTYEYSGETLLDWQTCCSGGGGVVPGSDTQPSDVGCGESQTRQTNCAKICSDRCIAKCGGAENVAASCCCGDCYKNTDNELDVASCGCHCIMNVQLPWIPPTHGTDDDS